MSGSRKSINWEEEDALKWSEDDDDLEFNSTVEFPNRSIQSSSVEKKESAEEILQREKLAKKQRKKREKIVLELQAAKLKLLETQFQNEEIHLQRKLQQIEREERARLREEQDREYEEVLRISRLEAEKALLAIRAEEERKNKIEEQKNKVKIYTLPFVKYDTALSPKENVYKLKFKLPTGVSIIHTFDKREHMSVVLQQLRFDLQSEHPLSLSIPNEKRITRQNLTKLVYEDKTRIISCGIGNNMTITVDFGEDSDSEADS